VFFGGVIHPEEPLGADRAVGLIDAQLPLESHSAYIASEKRPAELTV